MQHQSHQPNDRHVRPSPSSPDLNGGSLPSNDKSAQAREAGQYLMADPTPVSTEEAKEALSLLVSAGFDPGKLAATFDIPLENVPDIVVKGAKSIGKSFVESVEETIRNSVQLELDVFEPGLEKLLDGANRDIVGLLHLEAKLAFFPHHPDPSQAEIDAAAQALDAAGVDLRKAGFIYGLLPERVAEFFARDLKSPISFYDSVEARVDNARQNGHPIFKDS